MKIQKTNAMRILDKEHIEYQIHSYDHGKEAVDGMHVCQLLHQNPEMVFKTLICTSHSKKHYVFVVPVDQELDLKKCAKAVQEKSMEMIPVKELLPLSGYVRGGCSPIGMKKQFFTVFHESCLTKSSIYFSAGKIGLQIETDPKKIIALLNADTADIIKK